MVTTESRRPHRVADLLHHEIAWVLQRRIKDPRIGFVTLTGVEVTADLRRARVYYTVLGQEAEREETARGLRSASPFIRRALGRRLRLRVIPELEFVYDSATERGLRVQETIEELGHEPEDPDR